MKANELMICDWVSYSEGCYQVDGFFRITNTLCLRYNGCDAHYEDSTKVAEDSKPIPLTAEILEKNGWKRNGGYPEYNLPINNGTLGWSMDTHMIRIRNNADFETNDIFVRCGFVHELQHALRLCGLNELADNFKV